MPPSFTSTGPVFIISGTPGSGKSTVSTALMQRFEFGLHVPVDDLREWVVSGVAHPVPEITSESSRQTALARQSTAQLAGTYARAGFAVAIDDVMDPENADILIERALAPLPVHKVLLRPEASVSLKRNAERTYKPFDSSILISVIERIYNEQNLEIYGAKNWLVLDSSTLTVDETVDAILLHFLLEPRRYL